MHIKLCDRMRISYFELLATPPFVVQDYVDDMNAEAAAKAINNRWEGR